LAENFPDNFIPKSQNYEINLKYFLLSFQVSFGNTKEGKMEAHKTSIYD
jgi:hypothetical protein